MTKRDQRREVEKVLRDKAIVEVWQDKPYTAVRVLTVYNDIAYWKYGFAKIQYPDKWDPDYGIALAIDKAIAKISKEIIDDYTT